MRDDSMDCKEYERLIPGYIAQKLSYAELKRFCRHTKECGECREELTIQYLTTEGIQRLEDGGAFDLQKELDQHEADARRKIRFHDVFLHFGLALEVAAVSGIFGLVVWIIV